MWKKKELTLDQVKRRKIVAQFPALKRVRLSREH